MPDGSGHFTLGDHFLGKNQVLLQYDLVGDILGHYDAAVGLVVLMFKWREAQAENDILVFDLEAVRFYFDGRLSRAGNIFPPKLAFAFRQELKQVLPDQRAALAAIKQGSLFEEFDGSGVEGP